MSRDLLLIFCALTIRKQLPRNGFERSGRGQEPSRGHKFSILENVLSIRDFTSQTLASFPSDLVGVVLVGATPLHLACARPFGRLKAPLGLSLLRCAAQTRTFENTLISAACKKTQGKLWQKERGPDGASPLDRIMRCSKISAVFIAVFKNNAEQNGIFTICSLRILLRWENRIRQKDKVSAGKIRTRQ